MAESKHTPGPLHASCEVGNSVYIRDANGRYLATVNSLEDGIDNKARLEESAANADLFAAAPDLLEACQAMIDWEEAEDNAKPYSDDNGAAFMQRAALCREAFSKARAAIAKAKEVK